MAVGWLLAAAIVSEVIGTAALRESDGFSKPLPTIVMAITYGLSFLLLALVLREMPVGIAYAIWAGAGTALIAIVGVAAFGEHINAVGVLGIGLVIAGIIMLNLSGAH